MKHHRSPTHNYTTATLALRNAHSSISTLLSPLRSIADDTLDDFQSNAWTNARPPLTGLGITYLRDVSANFYDQPLALNDSSLQMQVDGEEELPVEPRRTDTSIVSYQEFGFDEGYRIVQRASNFVPSLCDERNDRLELGLNNDIDPTASDVIGLIPDVNMFDELRLLDLPYPGVNPLDTICSASLDDTGFSGGGLAPPTLKDCYAEDIFPTIDSRAERTPSPRVIQDIMSILVQPVLERSHCRWSPANSPCAASFSSLQPAVSRSSVPTHVSDNHATPAPCNSEYPNTTHSSPILNAHLGIELNELVSRAERFRTKYPERDIDRAWLSHFAGKLSDRGELLDDFRCYVIGCDQRNKRRDHILVHVGAHVGQRPFACSVCPLRFLRKNECKRHEASHSGFRPYSCDICSQSFVRQDLVKRHVKRTHGLRDENESGITKQPRKRARLR